MRLSLLLPAALLVAACEAIAPPAPAPVPAEPGDGAAVDACGADALSAEFVGGNASVLLATTFTIPVRFIRPGDAVTMDFNPNRANFEIDADEQIVRVTCG